MPLKYRKSKEVFGKNMEVLIREGKPYDQAVAIASKIQRGYKPNRLKKNAKKKR